MTTIRDVAKRAGVAPVTVSRAINGSGYVSAATRQRIEEAVAALGYVPNTVARSLRLQRTHTLALILTDITNPFWTTVARGVGDAARQAGYTVIFCNTDESEDEQARVLQVVLEKQVDGVLLVPARDGVEPLLTLRRQRTPVVLLDRQVSDGDVDVVRCDSESGAYQLTRHLLDLGHRRIVALNGPHGVATAEDRAAGYRRAMIESGLLGDDQRIFWGAFTQGSGQAMAQQALATEPLPTALFAANNFVAIGALRYLREAGLGVPGDVSLVAYDDLPPGLVVDPFLTVAAQPAYEMATRATELLLARLGEDVPQQARHIVLPVEMIVRRSSGPVAVLANQP